jgi:isoleucyl-tRNA synthetase
MKFKKVDPRQSFPALETEILKFWDDKKIFEKSIESRPHDNIFSFYDGPPFATGLPHYGHLLAGTIKDVIPRYKTMQGYRVERIWGWDTHGLPIENIVEQELDIKTKDQVEALGIDKFNELCRSKVLTYADEWKKIVGRTGRWADMESAYLTMSPEFMESVWWVFSELYKKGLAYDGHKVMPYCPRCATPLSNFEVGQGYKDKRDKAVTVKFELAAEPGTYFLAWTTTPWTLPGNLALSVGPKIEYAKVKTESGIYILAKERLENYTNELGEYTVLSTVKGSELVGQKYTPVMDVYSEVDKAFVVIDGDHVTTSDGTGIVHTAPAFGEDDFLVAKKHGIDFFMPVDDLGNFTIDVPEYAGKSVVSLETNEQIITDLGDKIFRVDGITHSYPHCWRCDTPLIYRGVSSWFVAVEKVKTKMLENNKEIYWLPDSIGHGRFQKLIENAPDWSISRNRFWGTPLPVWKCNECGKVEVLGSIAELTEKTGKVFPDIHLHKISEAGWDCECGGELKISGEVFDCWFESGSMPYASIHYPFENKEKFEKDYPADFIAEGIDQTRGWFYSLLVLSTALFGKSSYNSVIVNGTILAEDGLKMAKKLQNYPDPMHIVDTYGADAMRFYLMSSPAVKAEDFRFAERGVEEVIKKVTLTLWNSYSFYVTYASIDGFVPTGKLDLSHPMDHWIVSELNQLVADVTKNFDEYDLARVSRLLSGFIDDLSNWYIRRSRRRFWKSGNDSEKNAAYETLYHVLTVYIRLLAPYMPFVSDSIYHNLVGSLDKEAPESVHLTDWPKVDETKVDKNMNQQVRLARKVVEKGLKLRAQSGLNVRQPLSVAYMYDISGLEISAEIEESIKDELNVKSVCNLSAADTEVSGISIEKNMRLDFKAAGPRLGSKLKSIQAALSAGDYQLLEDGSVIVADESLSSSEVSFGLNVKSSDSELPIESDNQLAVVLGISVTPELQVEGSVRELVRKIQDGRKKAGFEVSDRIKLSLLSPEIQQILSQQWLKYIMKETLSEEILFEKLPKSDYNEKTKIDNMEFVFELFRV